MPGRIAEYISDIARRLATPSRYWALKAGLIVMAVSAVHAVPAYDVVLGEPTDLRAKSLHLFTHFGTADPDSHAAKLDFRLLAPAVLRPFRGHPIAAAVLYALCGIAAYALLAFELRRAKIPPTTVLLSLAAVGATAVGGVFLIDVRFFDALAITLATAAGAVTSRWLAAGLAVAALYTDERALLALVVVVAASRWIDAGAETPPRRGLHPLVFVAAFVAYGLSRIGLQHFTDLRTETADIGFTTLMDNIGRWPFALLAGFAFCWVGIVAGLGVAIRRDPKRGGVLVAILLVLVAVSLVVHDVTRSVSYALPAVPVAVIAIAQRWPERVVDRGAAVTFVGCMLVPAFVMAGAIGRVNPLPVQVLRWVGVL